MARPPHEVPQAEQEDSALPLAAYVSAASQRALRGRLPLLALLTLLSVAAGWTDALCYLALGRTFASIMSGNIIFVGLAIAQGDTSQLAHAVVAIVVFLVGITLGSRYLQTLPALRPAASWRRTLGRYLLVEGVLLLAFALVWSFTGTRAQGGTVQVVVLGVAAFSMGLQAALLGAFNILDINTVAITGTELLLGIRLAERIGGRWADRREGTSTVPFLLTLLLSYTAAGLVVALTISWIGTRFIPCLIVGLVAVLLLTAPGRSAHTGPSGD
jgi:uncharacterized membrane protein YoaK (UPF0700 family)